ncbi:hypothetical protein OH786_21925 [Streptomyces atratus]
MDGLDLHVEDLDAVDGTPVIEAKPWFKEMAPGARPTGPDGSATYSAATTPPAKSRPPHCRPRAPPRTPEAMPTIPWSYGQARMSATPSGVISCAITAPGSGTTGSALSSK